MYDLPECLHTQKSNEGSATGHGKVWCISTDTLSPCAGADDIQDPQEKYIQVEVWDHKFIKHFRGRVDIPLKSVLDNGKVKDKYRSVHKVPPSTKLW